MTEKKFWELIDSAQSSGLEEKALRSHLSSLLVDLSGKDLIDFTNHYNRRMDQLYDWRIWNAVYLIRGGCGDDRFFDFRDFLVSRGKATFKRVKADPESLLDDLDANHHLHFGEFHFHSTAIDVYEERNSTEFPRTHEWADLKGVEIDPDDEKQVKKHFPRIWAHLNSIGKR